MDLEEAWDIDDLIGNAPPPAEPEFTKYSERDHREARIADQTSQPFDNR